MVVVVLASSAGSGATAAARETVPSWSGKVRKKLCAAWRHRSGTIRVIGARGGVPAPSAEHDDDDDDDNDGEGSRVRCIVIATRSVLAPVPQAAAASTQRVLVASSSPVAAALPRRR